MTESPREKARAGISLIQEAILEVLYHARRTDDKACVRLVDIRNEIDMPKAKTGKSTDDWRSATTRFMLLLLQEDGKAQPCPIPGRARPGWQITDTAFEMMTQRLES